MITHAVTLSDVEMLDLSRNHGWNVDDIGDRRNIDGETPLNVACGKHMNDMIAYLIGIGANVDLQSGRDITYKCTNVHLCIYHGNRQGLRLFMKRRHQCDGR